jgi:hypothetical protein
LDFPPFGLACQISEGKAIVVGGGGDSQTGVPSGILLFELNRGKLRKLNFFNTFPHTFMNVAVHPNKEVEISLFLTQNEHHLLNSECSFPSLELFHLCSVSHFFQERVFCCGCDNKCFVFELSLTAYVIYLFVHFFIAHVELIHFFNLEEKIS